MESFGSSSIFISISLTTPVSLPEPQRYLAHPSTYKTMNLNPKIPKRQSLLRYHRLSNIISYCWYIYIYIHIILYIYIYPHWVLQFPHEFPIAWEKTRTLEPPGTGSSASNPRSQSPCRAACRRRCHPPPTKKGGFHGDLMGFNGIY